ncbi:hypothetical protein MTR_4g050255 [Medicago truncatula]|uniref:Uncharacterized protein n=1 Tax=Medicago truncatula TaxID=3880 RepID=A0A072UV25_MEDTR|nr:hypothetical protein MTR_4g050255 [Medicago truncatula]
MAGRLSLSYADQMLCGRFSFGCGFGLLRLQVQFALGMPGFMKVAESCLVKYAWGFI